MSDTVTKLDFIREVIMEDLASGKHEAPITRFPPEPNGYLHIGHAKSICLNFGVAQEFARARCFLRFDDTNPEKEEVEYVRSIQEDVKWLGFVWDGEIRFASNYFAFFYECAVELIRKGLAYVDHQTPEEMRATRGSFTQPGMPSPFRERSVEENLELFAAMKAGKMQDGECVLRAKIDMASSNMNLRDPVLYRIMHTAHHHTGDAWCIYPMYDFAHPLEDAYEEITHSLCTLEFEAHRALYDWVVEHCSVPARPRQIEFSRLNLSYTVMSKRKLLQLVKENYVQGWSDPRMPTISGLRRRGYTPAAVRNFCKQVGITKFNSVTDVALLEEAVRSDLNQSAPRRMAVLEPLKVVLTNWPDSHEEEVKIPNHPQDESFGARGVMLTGEVWIEREDFMKEPPRKFFRLGPDRCVRLRGGYIIRCTGFSENEQGEITEVRAEFLPDTIGKNPPEGVECRAAIHWVSVHYGQRAEVRLYDRLFSDENPDAAEAGFLSVLNPHSLEERRVIVEPLLAAAQAGERFQWERLGYFVADELDHQSEAPVFNRIVSLKDNSAKKG